MGTDNAILKKLEAAGYTVELRESIRHGRKANLGRRAIARDKDGIAAGLASAKTDQAALVKLAEMLGV